MQIETHDATVTAPVELEIVSSSGANVEVFVFDGDTQLAHHAFKFGERPFAVALPGLGAGPHAISVFVLAMKNLNRMYSVLVSFNHEIVAVADGDIPAGEPHDSGSGSLTLTV